MTYAIILVKGRPKYRETSNQFFQSIQNDPEFFKRTGVKIVEIFISFGLPDFVLILQGSNVELLKGAIIALKNEAIKNGDELETTTIICSKQEELKEKNVNWMEHFLA